MPELDQLCEACEFSVKGGPENKHGKVNVLMQVGEVNGWKWGEGEEWGVGRPVVAVVIDAHPLLL